MKKIFFILFIIFTTFLFSQTLEEDIKNFENDSAKGYLKPLNLALNSSMSAGLFNSAKVLPFLKFKFSLNTNFVLIPTSDKKFTAHRPDIDVAGVPLYVPEKVETATIFGNKGSSFNVNGDIANISDIDNINLPDGMNISILPFVAPQLNMGISHGIELSLRYLPLSIINNKTFSHSHFWGTGIKYGFPSSLPIDLSIYATYQSVNISSIVNINSLSSGIILGKKLLNFNFYGSLFYSYSKMKVKYKTETVKYQPPTFVTVPVNIKFDLEDKYIKPKLGFTYHLFLFFTNIEATIGKYPAYNFAIGVNLP